MKKTTLLLFGILVATMSSCVYSLFPIYTEDTLVFRKELLGKWLIDDEGSYFLFETLNESKASDEKEPKYSIKVSETLTMSSDEPLFIMVDGKKVYDEDSIIMIMNQRMAKNEEETISQEKKETKGLLEDIDFKEVMKEQIKEDNLTPKDIEYSGTVSVYEEKSYRLTIGYADGKKEAYMVHLVEIGEDLFMDLYPEREFDSENVSDNYFPVHTFYKVLITEEEFTMIHFDLDKLNKLFESNLIRLRHENVDGTILITAQPKELQKFLDKYSDDDSVFDSVETYKRAS